MADTPLRAYRAACPGCGAQVSFTSLASTHAVCGYCRSTLARQGDALARIGKAAEIFDNYSPLQIGSAGRFEGRGFSVVGRLQYSARETAAGQQTAPSTNAKTASETAPETALGAASRTTTWTDWAIAFDNGSLGSLSEDNGRFVLSRPVAETTGIPPYTAWQLGNTRNLLGRSFTVSSLQTARISGAEGELGKLPPDGTAVQVAELRSSDGLVLSLEYTGSGNEASAYLGQSAELDQLALTGLRQDQNQTVEGKGFNCPSCAHPIQLKLQSSQSCTCPACRSIIDLSQGLGAALSHAANDEPIEPALALGSVGKFEGKSWQIVGYQHRMGGDMQAYDEEQFGWEEYLLHNAKAGFAFLIDSDEGWTWCITATGAPTVGKTGAGKAQYLGQTYSLFESYTATTGYVAGEFYWPVERGYKTFHQDYRCGKNLLSKEQHGNEVVWSLVKPVTAEAVIAGFNLKGEQAEAVKGDSGIFSGVLARSFDPSTRKTLAEKIVFQVVAVSTVLLLAFGFNRCSENSDRKKYCQSIYQNSSAAQSGLVSYEEHMKQCMRGTGSHRSSGGYGGSWGGHK